MHAHTYFGVITKVRKKFS